MKLKRALTDPTFWILLGVNVALVYSYEQNPGIFTTLIWLYWWQSVLYGIFTFLDILTTRSVAVGGVKVEEKNDKGASISAWFFLFHYGFFHLVYFIFLSTMEKTGPFEMEFFKKFLIIFVVFQVFSFIQHKIQNRKTPPDFGKMIATPYIRIIPMHLCILLPAFIGVSNLTVFLVLKVACDVIMYVATTRYYNKNEVSANAAMMNIDSGI